MQYNLLKNSLVTAVGRRGAKKVLSLPALFASMARREVTGFWALRAHQSPAWHMFLVQLAALALWKAGEDRLPEDGRTWKGLLRGLTRDYEQDEPWCLIVENSEHPAFLQPPDPGDLQWRAVPTPDRLDMLNSSKNFDVKHTVAYANEPEDWLYALVSLQTMAGYAGQGNYGIARMSSGLSSRPLLGLAPGSARDMSVCPSAWWRRDVERLLQGKRSRGRGRVGGPALLWCLPWPEGEQLQVRDLDPWFIEVCRRVRLEVAGKRMAAKRSNSSKPRIERRAYQGNVGDPWIPVDKKGPGKSLTLGRRGFIYLQLCDLLFSGDWKRPLLASHGRQETGEMVLVCAAFACGNHKTEGFHTRRVPVPDCALLESAAAAECAKQLVQEIRAFAAILRNSVAIMAAGGDWRRIKEHKDRDKFYERAQTACNRFDRHADRIFFKSLWERAIARRERSERKMDRVRTAFIDDLLRAARAEFELAASAVACSSMHRQAPGTERARSFVVNLRTIS